jgi:hypothetical protein
MTETTLALCKMLFPGIAMWLVGMCSNNQALDAPKVDLSKRGAILQQEISIPMDERYELGLQFKFQNRETYDSSPIAGKPSGANHKACSDDAIYSVLTPGDKVEMGAELDFEIIVSATDGKVVQKKRYRSRCIQGWGSLTKSRHFGYVDLPKGKQQITIINHSPVVMESGVTPTLFLAGVGAGYP